MAKGWDFDPSAFVGLVEEEVGKRLRIISMALLAEIVQRSPVGNPDLWNVNQEQVKNINRVNDINEALRNSPNFGYTDKNGNRRIRRGNKVGLADAVYRAMLAGSDHNVYASFGGGRVKFTGRRATSLVHTGHRIL